MGQPQSYNVPAGGVLLTESPESTSKTVDAAPVLSAGTVQVAGRRWGMLSLYLLSFILLAGLYLQGASFYSTSLNERPRHEDYRMLRPAGSRGLLFGVIGTAMMIVMHAYSIRKRYRRIHRFGALRYWLNFHIYMGIMGPLFILLHTSFKVSGLVAVSFWSMIAVSLSGFLGRYLYQQIPRRINGDRMTLEEMNALLGETEPSTEHSEEPGLLRAFWYVLRGDLTRATVTRHRRGELQHSGLTAREAIRQTDTEMRRKRLQRRIVLYEQIHQLFHYWHVIHKPFAVIMYLIMAVHIGVAIWTGYVRFI